MTQTKRFVPFSRCARAGLAMVLLGCAEPQPTSSPLRMGFDLWAGYFPAHLAQASGLFDSLGVQVELLVPENTQSMLADFAAHRTDVVAAAIADMIPVLQQQSGVRILFCSDESAGADAIVSRSVDSPTALSGKRIGVKFGGFAELLVRRMLDSAGLAASDVELVDIEAAKVPAALAAGLIDAGETWEPYLTSLRNSGYRTLFSSAQVSGLIVECLFAHEDVALARQTELRAFTDAWFLAQARLLANPSASLPIIAHALGQPPGTLSLDGVRFLDRAENLRRMTGAPGAPSLVDTFTGYEQFFASLGRLRRPVNAQQYIDPRFVQ